MGSPISAPTYAIGSWACGSAGFDILDANGTAWGVRTGGTSGIFDGPPVTLNQTNFPNTDGAFRSKNFRPVRTMVINGWAAGSTLAGAVASRRAFMGILGGGSQQKLTITDMDGLVLTAMVELGDTPKVTPAAMQFDWQLTLSAADSYLYGPVASTNTGLSSAASGLDWTGAGAGGLDWTGAGAGGLVWGTPTNNGLCQLTNIGTEVTWPTFTITGPASGQLVAPSIVNSSTGETLAYTGSLNPGDVLVISTAPTNRSVLLNGVPYRRFLTPAQFFSIPAGASITVQFQGTSISPTPLLTATVASAY